MRNRGFTLVEIIVGVAVFLIVVTAAYGAYSSLFQLTRTNQAKLLAVDLADEQLEIVRNMPYVNVGLTTGIPVGVLPQTQTLTRGGIPFTVGLTVRNLDLSTSTYQASSKLVEVTINCSTCKSFIPISLTAQVAPANLQSASTGGALVVQVLDSSGNPVPGATVDVQSTATSSIQNHDVTNNGGILDIVGVPQGLNAYNIQVSKTGYSSDRTYAAGSSYGGQTNANPTKPDATILTQQATQNTFSIDRLSSLHISSVTSVCTPIGGVHFNLTGAKSVGTTAGSVSIPKYNQNLVTNGAGTLDLPSLEWDTYTLTPNDSSYDVAGITPFSPLNLNPGNSQNIQLVVAPRQSNSLMITVADSATGLPISGASVHVTGPGGVDRTLVTGQGYLTQADWSGGSSQDMFSDATKYFADDSNVDTSSAGSVKLKDVFGSYPSAGQLESSTFDTGAASNFYTLSWSPGSQPILSGANSLKFQLASNATVTPTTTWSYIGPDGTNASYYTVTDSPISSQHNNNQFMRYLTFFSTDVSTSTPTLSNISFTYTSSCIPPGQVLFNGLSTGSYSVTVSKTGYTSWSNSVSVSVGWQNQTVQLGP